MKKRTKTLTALLAFAMIFCLLFTACSTEASKETVEKTASTNDSVKVEPTATTTATAEPKIKMTMFMGNSGVGAPDGVDISNNKFVNIVENYANVDLEIEIPGYQDYETKLNLLLASGKLPDLIHSYLPAETIKRADEGAFIDLKKYYDKSEPIKKYITEEMMELSKSDSGHYYRIPMAKYKGPQGKAVITKWHLVSKYNNDKWPENLDEWIALFRTMHKAEPESVVLYKGSLSVIHHWFAALPNTFRYEYDTGNVISTFELPEYKASVQVLKQLYDEGILDKEFATLDGPGNGDRWDNRNTLLEWASTDQQVPHLQVDIDKSWEILVAPPLSKYPAEVKDPKYAEQFKAKPISGHGLYISSTCKNPERAFRVIEGFACDEMYEAIFWGKEGVQYQVKDGKRVVNPEALLEKDHYYGLAYSLVFGFVDGQDVKRSIGEVGLGKERSDEIWNSVMVINDIAVKNGLEPTSFTVLSDDAKKKIAESDDFITQATYEAIMGKITMDQFDQRVKEYDTKYGFIADEHTKYIKEHKEELAKKGIRFDR